MFSRLLGVTLVALFSLGALVTATPADAGRLYDLGRRDGESFCGNQPSLDTVMAAQEAFTALLAENPVPNEVNAEASFTVPVIFHIIYDPANPSQGSVPLVIPPIFLSDPSSLLPSTEIPCFKPKCESWTVNSTGSACFSGWQASSG